MFATLVALYMIVGAAAHFWYVGGPHQAVTWWIIRNIDGTIGSNYGHFGYWIVAAVFGLAFIINSIQLFRHMAADGSLATDGADTFEALGRHIK